MMDVIDIEAIEAGVEGARNEAGRSGGRSADGRKGGRAPAGSPCERPLKAMVPETPVEIIERFLEHQSGYSVIVVRSEDHGSTIN